MENCPNGNLAKVAKFHTNPYNFLACLSNPYKLSILGDIWKAANLPFSASEYSYSWSRLSNLADLSFEHLSFSNQRKTTILFPSLLTFLQLPMQVGRARCQTETLYSMFYWIQAMSSLLTSRMFSMLWSIEYNGSYWLVKQRELAYCLQYSYSLQSFWFYFLVLTRFPEKKLIQTVYQLLLAKSVNQALT